MSFTLQTIGENMPCAGLAVMGERCDTMCHCGLDVDNHYPSFDQHNPVPMLCWECSQSEMLRWARRDHVQPAGLHFEDEDRV